MAKILRDIKERLRALSGGLADKTVLVRVANQLKDESFNPREILKAIKQETGIGLSLRTTFKRAEESKYGRKASNVVEQRIQNEIAAEAKQRTVKALEVGKSMMDKFELLAKFHGYTNVLDFANMTYDFWDIHHNHVRKLEEENLLLKQYVKKLEKILSQNNKKIARLHEWSELMQVVTACSMLDGKFPPSNLLYTLSKTYRTVVE